MIIDNGISVIDMNDILAIQSDVANLQSSVYELSDQININERYHMIDNLSGRIAECEEQIQFLKEKITGEILAEVARRFRDYFDTVQDPVSDEEFYKDLQALLFG